MLVHKVARCRLVLPELVAKFVEFQHVFVKFVFFVIFHNVTVIISTDRNDENWEAIQGFDYKKWVTYAQLITTYCGNLLHHIH